MLVAIQVDLERYADRGMIFCSFLFIRYLVDITTT